MQDEGWLCQAQKVTNAFSFQLSQAQECRKSNPFSWKQTKKLNINLIEFNQ